MTKQEYVKTMPKPTNNRGTGLFLQQQAFEGDLITEYCGEIIDFNTYNQRIQALTAQGQSNVYMFQVISGMFIDAAIKGNTARFINHSCSPNCQAQKWHVQGDTRIGIFALRDLPRTFTLLRNSLLFSAPHIAFSCS
jgi:SET domain-containing protein